MGLLCYILHHIYKVRKGQCLLIMALHMHRCVCSAIYTCVASTHSQDIATAQTNVYSAQSVMCWCVNLNQYIKLQHLLHTHTHNTVSVWGGGPLRKRN